MIAPAMYSEEILSQVGCPPGVIEHSKAVSRLAVSLAVRARVQIDAELVRLGGLFHDIGRSRTQGIDHAIVGAAIARELGFPEPILRIIERHIGAGITAGEAARLGLPKKDYIPATPEEKIVSYADNLVMGITVVDFEKALERFEKTLGADHEGVRMFIRQHEEIQGWLR